MVRPSVFGAIYAIYLIPVPVRTHKRKNMEACHMQFILRHIIWVCCFALSVMTQVAIAHCDH